MSKEPVPLSELHAIICDLYERAPEAVVFFSTFENSVRLDIKGKHESYMNFFFPLIESKEAFLDYEV